MNENTIEIKNEVTQNNDVTEENTEQVKLFAGKYKTPEDLEKGYKELSTLVRAKHPTAPEEYDFSELEDIDIDGENPLLNTMQEVMKNQNLSQEQAKSLTQAFVEYDKSNSPNIEDEVKKLGSDAPVMINQVEGFMKRYLNESESAILSQVGSSAAGIKLLYKLSNQVGERTIPAGGSMANDAVADLRAKATAMLEDPNLRSNPEKQEEYDAIWQKISRLEG